MIRTLLASCLLVIPALAFGAAAPSKAPGAPPDSFDPNGPRAKITLSHAHQRVLACEPIRKKDKPACKAKREAADSSGQLQLVPVRAPDITDEDKRQPISVQFPSKSKGGEQEVSVPAGLWEIDWAGRKQHERFQVQDGVGFKISLRSTSGSCVLKQTECRLDPSKLTRSVKIPAAHRVAR
jgi:hypothetical protein